LKKHKIRSPLLWIGGKARLLNWILDYLDVPCRSYIEPFGGSASVLLNRPRVPLEVYNDSDGELVNLLRCVSAHPDELVRQVDSIPYSREIYKLEAAWLRSRCLGSLTDLQRAARFWWLNLASYGGLTYSGGFSTSRACNHAARTRRHIASLHDAAERLKDVVIENADFREVINRYSDGKALIYCDPPYVGKEYIYQGGGSGFSESDHHDLAKLLNTQSGQVAVSYYPCDLVEELYPPNKWHRVERRHLTTLPNSRNTTTASRHRTELLLLNYEPEKH
jgi:DNA adenine methylase